MEARTAFDRLLIEGEPSDTAAVAAPAESDDVRVARQNREALNSWASLGLPVPVIK